MLKFLYIILLAYLIYKGIQFFKGLFSAQSRGSSEKVYDSDGKKNKIDKKDVIDAQFEDIDVSNKSSSKN